VVWLKMMIVFMLERARLQEGKMTIKSWSLYDLLRARGEKLQKENDLLKDRLKKVGGNPEYL